jgi:hypothetical protein
MAFEYKDEIKNILLSMSFDDNLPTGSWVGYGFKMEYSASSSGYFDGAISMWDEYILSTGTASASSGHSWWSVANFGTTVIRSTKEKKLCRNSNNNNLVNLSVPSN